MNPENITIQKIKYKDDRVILKWTDKKKNGENNYRLDSFEKPRPGFPLALERLSRYVIEICELPEDYKDRIEVLGVSLSWTDGIMGATITALMELYLSNAPLVINTPHKPVESYSEGGEEGNCLDSDCVDALNNLIEEAILYIRGNRAQTKLEFPEEKSSDLKEEVKDHFQKEGILAETA